MKKICFFFLAFTCSLACEKALEKIAVTSVSSGQDTAEMIIGEPTLMSRESYSRHL